MKKRNIILIVALSILLPIVFSVLLVIAGLRLLDETILGDYVCDEERVIEEVLVDCKIRIPETATNLHYSYNNGIDVTSLIALTLSSNEECEELMENWFGAPIENFQRFSELPLIHVPGKEWLKEHERWDILQYSNFLIYTENDTRYFEIVYVPEHFRIFLYLSVM